MARSLALVAVVSVAFAGGMVVPKADALNLLSDEAVFGWVLKTGASDGVAYLVTSPENVLLSNAAVNSVSVDGEILDTLSLGIIEFIAGDAMVDLAGLSTASGYALVGQWIGGAAINAQLDVESVPTLTTSKLEAFAGEACATSTPNDGQANEWPSGTQEDYDGLGSASHVYDGDSLSTWSFISGSTSHSGWAYVTGTDYAKDYYRWYVPGLSQNTPGKVTFTVTNGEVYRDVTNGGAPSNPNVKTISWVKFFVTEIDSAGGVHGGGINHGVGIYRNGGDSQNLPVTGSFAVKMTWKPGSSYYGEYKTNGYLAQKQGSTVTSGADASVSSMVYCI